MARPRLLVGHRRGRRIVLAVAAACLALGTAGCSVTNEITTLNEYAASDGILVDVGHVRAINLLVLTSAEGAEGAAIGALTNRGDDAVEVTLALADGSASTTFDLTAGGTVTLGPDQDEQFAIDAVPTAPGTYIEVSIGSDRDGSTTVRVPVLDGTLPEYADLVP